MRTKILLAVVLTLTLVLSSCANQPTSEQLVEEQLALISPNPRSTRCRHRNW